MNYFPNSDEQLQDMLKLIGVARYEDLLSGIPAVLGTSQKLDLPRPLSELELLDEIRSIASKNDSSSLNFLGGGSYDHYIPAVVDFIIGRSEFYTAYTPYQAEVSQGTLQAMYEYQSMICALTGMDVANASMYDGATALAEAVMMASHVRNKSKILVPATLNPAYRQVLDTYAASLGLTLVTVASDGFNVDLKALITLLDDDTAAVVLQSPNYFGYMEEAAKVASLAAEKGALLIMGTDPVSLGILKSPGDYGADIVFAEGQALGNHRSFGGPYLGIFAAKKAYIRKMPGRIIGATSDTQGRKGFVLTLQTREQHIRREKATSNICSNQGLNALAATVYLALMGKHGLKQVAELSTRKAHYLHDEMCKINGFSAVSDRPFFKEFTIKTPIPAKELTEKLYAEHGIFAGIPLSDTFPERRNELLVAVTEKRRREDLDRYIGALKSL